MSISYKEATELLSALQDIEIPEENLSDLSHQKSTNDLQILAQASMDNGMNISALSFESCDTQELMHCYQLALDFGVPTARRALALYQSRSLSKVNNPENSQV